MAVIELTVGSEGDTSVVDAGIAKAAVGDMEKPVTRVSQEIRRREVCT